MYVTFENLTVDRKDVEVLRKIRFIKKNFFQESYLWNKSVSLGSGVSLASG